LTFKSKNAIMGLLALYGLYSVSVFLQCEQVMGKD